MSKDGIVAGAKRKAIEYTIVGALALALVSSVKGCVPII